MFNVNDFCDFVNDVYWKVVETTQDVNLINFNPSSSHDDDKVD